MDWKLVKIDKFASKKTYFFLSSLLKIKIRSVGPRASPPGWPGLAQPTSNFAARGQPEPVFLQILARARTLIDGTIELDEGSEKRESKN